MGILYDSVVSVIGNGVVIDPGVLLKKEIDTLAGKGIYIDENRLRISSIAHVILPIHQAIDSKQESLRRRKDWYHRSRNWTVLYGQGFPCWCTNDGSIK